MLQVIEAVFSASVLRITRKLTVRFRVTVERVDEDAVREDRPGSPEERPQWRFLISVHRHSSPADSLPPATDSPPVLPAAS